MIRIGLDLTQVDRFSFLHTSGGQMFYRRVYTEAEQIVYKDSLCELAACFAGKEAVSKVLGTGLSFGEPDRVSCTDIEILLGQPHVRLFNQAQRIAHQLGLANVVLRYFFAESHIVAVAGATNREVPRGELLNCIEQAGAQIASQMSH